MEKAASLIVTEALVGIDDECGAGIHVDIFEADIAIEDEGGIFGNDVEINVNTLLESEIVLAAATALITATLLLLLRPPIVKSRGEAERRISILRVVGISLLTALCALVYLVAMGHEAIQTKK